MPGITQIIGDILNIFSPTITLILTVLGLLSIGRRRTTAPLDTPSLKILQITRTLSEEKREKYLQQEKLHLHPHLFRIVVRLFIPFIAAIVALVVIIYLKLESDEHHIYAVGIYFDIFFLFILIAIFLSNLTKLRSQIFARYIFYDQVTIAIEADFHYLFDKCVDVLKRMNIKIIEVVLGNNVGMVTALQDNLPPIIRSICVMVTLKKIENSESAYWVMFEFISDTDILSQSKFRNDFIDRLISKPSTRAGDNKRS